MINRLIFILSILGLLVSGYLLERYISGGRIACGVSGDCDLVRQSAYSHFYGIPLPLFGILFYLIILTTSFIKTIHPIKLLNFILLTFSSIGLLVSLYLFYIEVALIQALCLWCTVSGIISLFIFLLVAVPKKYFSILVTVSLFVAIYLVGVNVSEETVREMVKNAGVWGPLVLIFLIWLTNVFAPLGATPFLFAGFYLYDQTIVIYTFIATTLALVSNFLIAKKWGRPFVEKLVGINGLQKVDNFMDEHGKESLLVVRICLSQFHDVVSYAYGLTKISFWPYFIWSFLGMIPGTLLWYWISIHTIGSWNFLFWTYLNGYLSLGIYILIRKIIKRVV